MASQEQLKEHPNIKKVVSLEKLYFYGGLCRNVWCAGNKNGCNQHAQHHDADSIPAFDGYCILHYGDRRSGRRTVGSVYRVRCRCDYQ